MPYCTVEDVRLIVKTSLTDPEISKLLEVVDDDIDDWITDNQSSLTPRKKRRLAMYMTAVLIAVREPEAAGAGDYGGFAKDKIEAWQQKIDEIKSLAETESDGIPFVVAHEPIDC